MRDLVVVVPSRGRPQNVRRLREAMDATCRGDTTLVVGLDSDDEGGYERLAGVEYEVRSGLRGFTPWVNELAVPRAGTYRFTGALGDDCVPQTPGWDARIMAALGREPFAYANDLYPLRPQGSQVTHAFMRSEVVQALGYLGVPSLTHMFVDDAWGAWGAACGIEYLGDVIIEHLHHSSGKAPLDETYLRAEQSWPQCQAAYSAYCRGQLAQDIGAIKAVL
jgi:hypothetical protein